MGLDLYSGSLSKFYAREYETPQARFAKENNLPHQTLYAEGGGPLDREKAKQAISVFLKNLSEYFVQSNGEFTSWDETKDLYLTEQLHEECFKALQVMCLSAYRKEDFVGAFDDAEKIDSFLSMKSREEYFESGHAVLECQLFVPGIHDQCTPADDGIGGRVIMTTTSNLRQILDMMNSKIWGNNAQPKKWFERGPVARGKVMEVKRGFLPWKKTVKEVDAVLPANPLMRNAEYAFGVFSTLLSFAEKHHLPIRQDS